MLSGIARAPRAERRRHLMPTPQFLPSDTGTPHDRLPTRLPRVPGDLLLAPVAVAIDLNLQHFRHLTVDELRLELDILEQYTTREERVSALLRVALKGADTHHWLAEITDDGARLRLTGGSVSLDLGLSRALMHYIQGSNGH
jgi:hypothetical protein